MFPAWFSKAVAGLLVAGVLAAGVLYQRSQWIEQGRQEVQAVHAQEVQRLRTQYEAATVVSRDRFNAALAAQKEQHERTTQELRSALDASGLRELALSRQLARLHDKAAGSIRAATPAEPPGGPSDPAEDAPSGVSVATLIETVNENYAICNANSAQLVELQDWYNDLRERSRLPAD